LLLLLAAVTILLAPPLAEGVKKAYADRDRGPKLTLAPCPHDEVFKVDLIPRSW
jgi:hypothetical protein